MFESLRRLLVVLIDFLREVNLFASVPPTIVERDLRNERISTRLFVISLVLLICILVSYNSLINVTKTADANNPTLTQYRYLYSKYSQRLSCTCTKASIRYERFLRVNYTLHQVCSSIFVSDQWITYLAHNRDDGFLTIDGFQSLGTYIFQALKTFCRSCDKSISDSLTRFYFDEYASLSVTSEQLFQPQFESVMKEFKSSTLNDFSLSLQIIRDTTQANALVSALQTNYLFLYHLEYEFLVPFPVTDGEDYGCDLSASFISQLVLYNDSQADDSFNVTGLYSGCYITEALLQSTLECFYNQTCINILQTYMSSLSMNVSALDSSLLSRFEQNSTIESLVDVLMVEEWNLSSVYEDYYKECQPKKCIYTYVGRNDAIYIVTTVIGLIGGLVKVLMLLIPKFVKFSPRILRAIQRYLRSSKLETGKF